MTKKIYDIWMPIHLGTNFMLTTACAVLNLINLEHGDNVLIDGLYRIGCSYCIRFESDEEVAEEIRKHICDKFKTTFEESRGFRP